MRWFFRGSFRPNIFFLLVCVLFCLLNQNTCEKKEVGKEKFYGAVITFPTAPQPSESPAPDLESARPLVQKPNQGTVADELDDDAEAGRGKASRRKSRGCHYDIDIDWIGKLPASPFKGPVITNFKLGNLQKVLLFYSSQYFEVLHANTGSKLQGFPFILPINSFISARVIQGHSPRIALTTVKGEIIFVGLGGTVVQGSTLIVPPLGIEKNWYEGLEGLDEHASMTLQQGSRDIPVGQPEMRSFEQPLVGRSLKSLQDAKENYYDDETEEKKNRYYSQVFELFEGSLPTDGLESLELFLPTESPATGLMAVRGGVDPLESRQYAKFLKNLEEKENLVYLDPKVFANTVTADLNGDGTVELIVPVSFMVSPRAMKDVSVDPRKYVACALVVFDLSTQDILWKANLDLTTGTAHYQAHIYADPVVVDLDGDGNLDILVTTGVGHIFAFDNTGKLHPGYPLRTNTIRAKPVVFDLDHDAALDLIIVDTEGLIKVWNVADLSVKWETKISPDARAAPVFADINGDGVLDLILGTGTGHIWALSGDTGDPVGGFPVSTGTRIHSQISLFDMNGDSVPEFLVSGFKNQLSIIDPTTMCLELVNFAEPIINSATIDDVTGDGLMDIVVVSTRGSVYTLNTDVPFDPLQTWADAGGLETPQVFRPHHYGVMIEGERERYYYGPTFTMSFTIIDKRRIPLANKTHHIQILLNGEVILSREIAGFLEESATFFETLDCPRTNRAALELILTNKAKQPFYDLVDVHFNWNYYRTLKWLVVLPYLLMVAGFMLIKQISSPLPS